MSKSVIASQLGFDYQARLFWLRVVDLFLEHTKTRSVGFELDEAKSFDDVVVKFSSPIPEAFGLLKTKDYYQSKFHSHQTAPILYTSLTDPKYINATKFSFLQKLLNARTAAGTSGEVFVYNLFTPSTFDTNDPIAPFHNNNDNRINLDRLFGTKTDDSITGAVRKNWREHLGIVEEDLRDLLGTLRIITGPSAKFLLERLNNDLYSVGFVPIESDKIGNEYDDLIRKLHAWGKNNFTREDIIEIATREGLWRGSGRFSEEPPRKTIGIRSFIKFAEEMPNRTIEMICLSPYFEGRFIKNEAAWANELMPRIDEFVQKFESEDETFFVLLDTHISIAFAAGHALHPKATANFVPVQKNQFREPESWNVSGASSGPGWKKDEISVNAAGGEIAVAIGVTHSVVPDVKDFVERPGPNIREIFSVEVDPNPSPNSIVDGNHAFALAADLANLLIQKIKTDKFNAIHLFAAAPVGFMFYFGKALRTPSNCPIHLYEYDFESKDLGAYKKSFTLEN